MKVLCAHRHPCYHSSRCWLGRYGLSLIQTCYTIIKKKKTEWKAAVFLQDTNTHIHIVSVFFWWLTSFISGSTNIKKKQNKTLCLIRIHRYSEIPLFVKVFVVTWYIWACYIHVCWDGNKPHHLSQNRYNLNKQEDMWYEPVCVRPLATTDFVFFYCFKSQR